MQNHPRHLERLVRIARGGPRSAERRDALSLRAGRPRPRDSQFRKAAPLSFDSRRGTQARRGFDLVARRRSDRSIRRILPRAQKHRHRRGSQVDAARRSTGPLYPRGFQGRPRRRPQRSADHPRPARNHQRPVDEGHGRSRAPVQRQPDDRRRSSAIGRGDEGRGRAPRTAHAEVRERDQGQDYSRHRQGRRARHRQEPGRDNSQQQRLPRRQSRHQGSARGTDQGVPRARPRRHRAVGLAGEVGADDGRDGAGLEDRRHRLSDPGRRRRALEPVHAE